MAKYHICVSWALSLQLMTLMGKQMTSKDVELGV